MENLISEFKSEVYELGKIMVKWADKHPQLVNKPALEKLKKQMADLDKEEA